MDKELSYTITDISDDNIVTVVFDCDGSEQKLGTVDVSSPDALKHDISVYLADYKDGKAQEEADAVVEPPKTVKDLIGKKQVAEKIED